MIAIDIGTTSAKCFSVSPEGEIISSDQRFYTTHFSRHGFAEQDPDLIFKSVIELLKNSIIPSSQCVGISFSAAMHSLTAIDDQGHLILPLLIWSDTRSVKQSKRIIESGWGQKFYEITGTPIHPMSPLCKLIWLKENVPDVFNKAHKFLSIKEYVLFRLTGELVIDHSTASATGIFDLEKLDWSDEVLRYIALDKEKLSRPVPVEHLLFLQKNQAAYLQLDEKTPLIVGASDGCLAQWGSDALSGDDITITLGTSAAVRVASSRREIDPHGKVFNYILNDRKFICGGATNCGSALLTWFRNSIDANASEDIQEFAKQSCQAPTGCDGLLTIPFLLGERAPVYDPDASGIFWGVKMHHTKIYFQRSLLEGICFEIKWILETVEEVFGKRNNVIVSGGIIRSQIWLQLLCDVIGRKIITYAGMDASAAGATRLGFEALKMDYVLPKANPSIINPDLNATALYEKHFLIFKEIYNRLKDLKLENK